MKIFTLSLLFLLSTATSGAGVIDGIAAKVGERIITMGEVVTESKIMAVQRMDSGAVDQPVEGSFSEEVLEQMINRELAYHEARRLRDYREGFETLAEVESFKQKFSDTSSFNLFLEREGLSAGDIAERFLMEKVVSAFVAERLSLMATVSPREIEDYYKDNISRFAGKDIKDAEDEIRMYMSDRKTKATLDEWLYDLRKRNNVRYFILPPLQPLP